MFYYYFEKWYPLVGALIVFMCFQINPPSGYIDFQGILCRNFVTIFSVFAGFLMVSLSSMLLLNGIYKLKALKASGVFHALVTYHWKAFTWSICAIISSLDVSIVTAATFGSARQLTVNIMLGMCTGALLSFLRIFYLFVRVLYLDKE